MLAFSHHTITFLFVIFEFSDGVTVHRNCEDWRLHRHTTNGYYLVDPVGNGGGIQVECDLTSNPARTTVHHNQEARTFFTRNLVGNQLKLDVTYSASLEEIDAIKSKAHSCTQYVKFDCYRERLILAETKARWHDRHGSVMTYWGDVKHYSRYCECGVTGTCQKGGKCNCAAGDATWRYDDGYLTDKTSLPLTRFVSDSLDGHSRGYHTIGPLVCIDVDPREWIETPEGVTTVFVVSVLGVIFVVMAVYTFCKTRAWKECKNCQKKQTRNVRMVEPLELSSSTPRAVLTETTGSSQLNDAPPRYSASIKKSPMPYTIIPMDNYEPGLSAKNFGKDTEALTAPRRYLDQHYFQPKAGSSTERSIYTTSNADSRDVPYKTTINSPEPWEKGKGNFPWEDTMASNDRGQTSHSQSQDMNEIISLPHSPTSSTAEDSAHTNGLDVTPAQMTSK